MYLTPYSPIDWNRSLSKLGCSFCYWIYWFSSLYNIPYHFFTITIKKLCTTVVSNTPHSLITVEYTRGQDAFLLSSGQYLGSKESAIAAISPDGRVIVVASENNLLLYNAVTTKLDANISNIFRGIFINVEGLDCLSHDTMYRRSNGQSRIR